MKVENQEETDLHAKDHKRCVKEKKELPKVNPKRQKIRVRESKSLSSKTKEESHEFLQITKRF